MTNHALNYGRDRPNEASQYPTILSTRFKFTMYAEWCLYNRFSVMEVLGAIKFI